MNPHIYQDFDAFADEVSSIDARMMLQNPRSRIWTINRLDLPGAQIQLGLLGSGNIVEGQSWPDGYLLYLPLTKDCPYAANGTTIERGSLMVLEPGCEFCIATKDPHDWCSIFVPPEHLFADGSPPSWSEAGKTPIPLGPLDIPTTVKAGAGMKAWIVNLVGFYNLMRTEKTTLEVLAGARYLSLDVDFSVDVGVLPGSAQGSPSDHVWDAIIGVRGLAFLNDKWYLNYRFDIGTGVSDLTWNAAVQFGRRYNWGSLMLGYRYLRYDFDSDFKILKDLDVHGPLIGAAWEF